MEKTQKENQTLPAALTAPAELSTVGSTALPEAPEDAKYPNGYVSGAASPIPFRPPDPLAPETSTIGKPFTSVVTSLNAKPFLNALTLSKGMDTECLIPRMPAVNATVMPYATDPPQGMKEDEVDSHSVDGGKRRYAAICTLVKEHKMLPKKIYIGSHVQALLYVEGPWWCTTCNHVGHMEKTCPEKPPVPAGDNIKEMDVVRMEPVNKVDWVPARRRRPLKKKEKKDTVEVGPVERWTPKKGERDPSETSDVGAKVTKNYVLSPQVSTGGNLETINPFHILQNNSPELAEEISAQITSTSHKAKRGPPCEAAFSHKGEVVKSPEKAMEKNPRPLGSHVRTLPSEPSLLGI
ncbi:hypothetical protein BVRB_9g217310 [Beta vulgaris subsp. vulgaris]|nr:hypothetical protein BVRB_9g217310 [Beta vulgaris subsp. vulgaris]